MRKSRATSEGEEPSLFVAQAQRAFKRVARKLRAESRQPRMRLNRLKAPFGTAKFCRLRNARYLTWRDAFDVEFASDPAQESTAMDIPSSHGADS